MPLPAALDRVSGFAVAAMFVFWFLLSLLVLVPKFRPAVRQRFLSFLVPEWKFFAPNPAQGEYHLLFRDQLEDGSVTPWTEVTFPRNRRWWNVAWNPDKRANKALFDAIVGLASEVISSSEGLVASIPYLTLLSYVSGLSRFSTPTYTQFMVLHDFSSFMHREPALVFSSELHSLQ